MPRYIVTLESDTPPKLMLGERVGGCRIIELKHDDKLVTASELAKRFNVSSKTIRDKLSSINQGTNGKSLYDPIKAEALIQMSKKAGRKRVN